MSTAQQEEAWPSPGSNKIEPKLFPGNTVTMQRSSLSAHQTAAPVEGNEKKKTCIDQGCFSAFNLLCKLKTYNVNNRDVNDSLRIVLVQKETTVRAQHPGAEPHVSQAINNPSFSYNQDQDGNGNGKLDSLSMTVSMPTNCL